MFTEAELAYAAGIIDGEGCLSISKGKNRLKGGKTSPNYVLMVKVSMSDAVVIHWLHQRWGGGIYVGKEKPPLKTMYSWQAWSATGQKFLEDIKPYLMAKREQAILLLAHRALVGRGCGSAVSYRAAEPGRQGTMARPRALTQVHERIYERVKALKRVPSGVPW